MAGIPTAINTLLMPSGSPSKYHAVEKMSDIDIQTVAAFGLRELGKNKAQRTITPSVPRSPRPKNRSDRRAGVRIARKSGKIENATLAYRANLNRSLSDACGL